MSVRKRRDLLAESSDEDEATLEATLGAALEAALEAKAEAAPEAKAEAKAELELEAEVSRAVKRARGPGHDPFFVGLKAKIDEILLQDPESNPNTICIMHASSQGLAWVGEGRYLPSLWISP